MSTTKPLSYTTQKIRDFFAWLFYYLKGLYYRTDEDHVFLLAGGLAFSLFVCVVPLTLLLFSILGVVLDRPDIALELDAFIERAIPYHVYAEFVRELVFSRVEEFKIFKGIAGLVGVVGLLFAATSLFSSMRTILDKVYRVSVAEPILLGKVRDLGLLAMVIVYFLLSTTLLPGWEILSEFANEISFLKSMRFEVVQEFIVGSITFLIIFVAFYIIYFLIPFVRQPKRTVFVSALSASIMWEIAKQGFGYYIANVATLKMIYGVYVLFVVVAFWVYYTAIVFIIGAEIGKLSYERHTSTTTPGSI